MGQMFRDEDADLAHLEGRVVAVLGYGNQGRAQALNLRDSGVEVIVGSDPDNSALVAKADGFEVVDLGTAAKRANVILLLLPDEVMPDIFSSRVRSELQAGALVVVASGYNLFYGLLAVPENVDVAMIAPSQVGRTATSASVT